MNSSLLTQCHHFLLTQKYLAQITTLKAMMTMAAIAAVAVLKKINHQLLMQEMT